MDVSMGAKRECQHVVIEPGEFPECTHIAIIWKQHLRLFTWNRCYVFIVPYTADCIPQVELAKGLQGLKNISGILLFAHLLPAADTLQGCTDLCSRSL